MRSTFAAASLIALVLATGPARGQAPPAAGDPPPTDVAISRGTPAGDPPLARVTTGKGTPVVIVTGVLGSAYAWRKVVPSLVADGFRVTIIDPLGFGASPHPDDADYSTTAQAQRVAATIAQVESAPVILVCQALAGPICLRIGYQRPQLVRGIVSVNGGASEQAGTAQIRFALTFARIVLFFAGRNFALHKVRDGLVESSGDTTWVTPATVNAYVAPFGSDAREVVRSMQRIVSAREPEPLRPNLGRVRAPYLLLYGPVARNPKDPPLAADEREILRTHLPHFQEEVVNGAGQFIQEEQPQRVVAAIQKMRTQTR